MCRWVPRDQILLRNWHPQCWWTWVQSAHTCRANVSFSEYYAGLAKTRYKQVSTCGVDPYMLKKIGWSQDLADYLVPQTSWIA